MIATAFLLAPLRLSDANRTHAASDLREVETALVEDAPLFGSKWRLMDIGGVAVKTTKPYIQLDEAARRFSGDGGCNRMSGMVEVSGRTVTFSRIISTRRACVDQEVQQTENDFMAGLERASSFYIRGDVMRLYAKGIAILTFKTDAPTAPATPAVPATPARKPLQPNSLCEKNEQTIFSCRLRRPVRIVSLCASPDLELERGYLQYRFGLPTRIELEFPKTRESTQEQFAYTHYMRYQVDLTEINFSIDGNRYQIFDSYNGEEKPRVMEQGVIIERPNSPSVTYRCLTRPKADFSKLTDVLRPH